MNVSNESSFVSGTQIIAGGDARNYDDVAAALHWATAFLVLFQFLLAEIWQYFDRPTRESMQSLHVSLGVLFTIAVLARIMWRMMPGHQVSSLARGWLRIASRGVHYLLYALLLAQASTGLLLRWAQRQALLFFGLPIPSPLGPISKAMRHQIHAFHEWIAWTLVIVAFGHALAALYHHYVLRDRVLTRMLPG